MGHNLAERPLLPLIPAPQEHDCGPAMKKCTPNERAFVAAMFAFGCQNYTDAAMATGRFSSRDSAQAASSRWMHSKRVLDALDEYTRVTMRGGLAIATRALLDIASDPTNPNRLKAASELLNRNGHIVETISRHIHEQDHTSTKELLHEIGDLARQLGVDPAKLLGATRAEVVDAEFEEVSDGTEGLEDLL